MSSVIVFVSFYLYFSGVFIQVFQKDIREITPTDNIVQFLMISIVCFSVVLIGIDPIPPDFQSGAST